MKIQPYIDKLNASQQYKQFIKKYKDAFLVAGFFILDYEMNKNIHQIDFYLPSQKKFAAFSLDEGVALQILNTVSKKVPEKLEMKTNIDLDALHGILEDEMKNRNITEEIRKIIAIVQTVKGRKIWNINSVLSGMDILKAHVDDESKTILKMEKTSIMDIMKKMPMPQQQPMEMQKSPEPGVEMETEPQKLDVQGPQTEEEAEDAIKKLDDLEKDIEKEKERLKQATATKGKNNQNNIKTMVKDIPVKKNNQVKKVSQTKKSSK